MSDRDKQTIDAINRAVTILCVALSRLVENMAVVMPQLAAMLDESDIDYSDDVEPDAVVTA